MPVDREIAQFFDRPLASAKRSTTERNGIHGWHPYYAGYSEAFVLSALKFLDCTPETVLLDPWGGSGTTNAVASLSEIPSIAIDVNPVMATFAAAKSPNVLARGNETIEFFQSLLGGVDRSTWPADSDPLLGSFDGQTAAAIRGVWDAIGHSQPLGNLHHVEHGETPSGLVESDYAFRAAVVFVTTRKLAAVKKMANPTWISNNTEKVGVDSKRVISELVATAKAMLLDLEKFYELAAFPREIFSLIGDVRDLPFPDETIDRIITSPPYLTRIDYAVSTAPEMSLFGVEDLVARIRHATTGAPVITAQLKTQEQHWGALCNALLDTVKSHPTKAASSYYWKNMVQYFADIDRALRDVFRVLKSGGRGLVVVQSSYFKEVEIPLGEIFVDMARGVGLSASIAARETVRSHMAHVNTRSNKYFANKVYFEDSVLIEKP